MRVSKINRETKETQIELGLDLDGQGKADIDTGIGFIDHMLTLFAFHGDFDLVAKCKGDLVVDSHHTVEDLGIVLGSAFKEALGQKLGIIRYGSFSVVMDEALVTTNLDISGRPFLVYNAKVEVSQLGNYDTEMTEEFFRAFVNQAGITLHINKGYGKNTHHIIEAIFKSVARALKIAVAIDETKKEVVSSSKGVL